MPGIGPHSFAPFFVSPSEVLQERTVPFCTVITGATPAATLAALAGGAAADTAGAAGVGPFATTLAGGASGARPACALAEAAASLGALGPSLTPTRRGQAIPMTNPTAAMTPTFTQPGL